MSVSRIIDANANRAREALRVMEDASRFSLNDEHLAARVKALRHGLRAALDRLPPGWLEANRDTPGDVGTRIGTPLESAREGWVDVVVAAGKRLTEALRVIEETGKAIDGDLAAAVEQLRYQAYDVDSCLQLRLGSGRARQWRVCLLLTEALCHRPWTDVVRESVRGGADCIQLREKGMADRRLVERARRLLDLTRPHGVSVVINDRADVALTAGADGVHLGQQDLSVPEVRRLAGRALLVGVSTHDEEEARDAVEAGADYCGVGAMFSSSLKPDRAPSGPEFLRCFLAAHPGVAHLAIGGITPKNVHELVARGARGVAVSSAICGADDPAGVVAELHEAVGSAVQT